MSLRAAQRPGHRVTTRHAQAIYPFRRPAGSAAAASSSAATRAAGRSVTTRGCSTSTGALDDPNAIVLGKLGQGKSALVKTLLWRMLLFGRRAFVLDVKREYGPLCQAVGVRPVSLAPGGGVRLNPLAVAPEEHAQLELLRAVAATALGDPLTQLEAGALREALRVVRGAAPASRRCPRSRRAVRARRRDGAALQTTPSALAADARRAALALQDLCEGPLQGDVRRPDHARARSRRAAAGPRPARRPRLARGRDPDGLRTARGSAPCWPPHAERPGRERLINVADESWKIVQHTGLGEWFQSNFKLARQFGVMNLVVLHKLADLQAAGDAGSRAARIAEGLVADASTRIVYHQDESQVRADPLAAGPVRQRGGADLDAVARTGAVARRRALVRGRPSPLADRAGPDQHRRRDERHRRRSPAAMSDGRAGAISDAAMLGAVALGAAVLAAVWLWGGLAGALLGGGWPAVAPGQLLGSSSGCPAAWPIRRRPGRRMSGDRLPDAGGC